MKTLLVALASASLLATSFAAVSSPAEAQGRGGGPRVGARGAVVSPQFRGGGGFRGGYSPGWGYRGGYGGYRGGYSGAWAGATLGFALGAGLAYPGYYNGYYGGYYGAPGYAYYPDYGYTGGYVSQVPQGYAGDPWAYDYGVSPATPQADGAQPPQACGSWSWDQAQTKYNWVPCPPSGG